MRLAVDIGYSNLKGFYGKTPHSRTPFTLPAGAGPADRAAQDLIGGDRLSGAVRLIVDSREWIAGIEPGYLRQVGRELHAEYPTTETYLALFLAALSLTDSDRIDCVVTGLPVLQYQDKELREKLRRRLVGEHRIDRTRRPRVDNVEVVPQAVGAFLDYAESGQWAEIAARGRVLVIDVGFYSVDWALLDAGAWQADASGSSVQAYSRVLDEVSQRLYTDYRATVSVERLERTIRAGEKSILVFGNQLRVDGMLPAAVRTVAPTAIAELQRSMRIELEAIDLVLLTGGGAPYYKEAAQSAFPRSKVAQSLHPVSANARGYWRLAW